MSTAEMLHAVDHSGLVDDLGEDPDRWLVMTDRNYGHTESGAPITDQMIERLADEAEAGFDVDEILARRGKRGRPRLGSAPSTVESVRLDPQLKQRLATRAKDEGVPVSEVIREALRQHLSAS
ncbi:CopG family transcriptional regulator [Candidatus Microthrix sp.]|nr:CopG family transcriptional regulator [Candidatus Microthrix sp.]